jgi:hypothetical protein
MIDLDRDKQGIPGAIAVVLYPLAQQLSLQIQVPGAWPPEQGVVMFALHSPFFLKALSGV